MQEQEQKLFPSEELPHLFREINEYLEINVHKGEIVETRESFNVPPPKRPSSLALKMDEILSFTFWSSLKMSVVGAGGFVFGRYFQNPLFESIGTEIFLAGMAAVAISGIAASFTPEAGFAVGEE